MRRGWWVIALVVLGCDGVDPGQVHYDLDTPFDDDGAVQLVVTVPAGLRLTDVAPTCAGCRVFQRIVSEREIRAVVVGEVVDGPFVAVSVSDRRDPVAVTLRVVAAASRGYVERTSADRYTVTRRP